MEGMREGGKGRARGRKGGKCTLSKLPFVTGTCICVCGVWTSFLL